MQYRVITTWRCNKACLGCCNTYGTIMSGTTAIQDWSGMKDATVVMLTGGEPMLDPVQLLADIDSARRHCPDAKIYLYTAAFNPRYFKAIVSGLDGLHYSIHVGASPGDLKAFANAQSSLAHHPDRFSKSFRLYVDSRVGNRVPIIPRVWDRVEVKPWETEEALLSRQPNGIPAGEKMVVLERPQTSGEELGRHITKILGLRH